MTAKKKVIICEMKGTPPQVSRLTVYTLTACTKVIQDRNDANISSIYVVNLGITTTTVMVNIES